MNDQSDFRVERVDACLEDHHNHMQIAPSGILAVPLQRGIAAWRGSRCRRVAVDHVDHVSAPDAMLTGGLREPQLHLPILTDRTGTAQCMLPWRWAGESVGSGNPDGQLPFSSYSYRGMRAQPTVAGVSVFVSPRRGAVIKLRVHLDEPAPDGQLTLSVAQPCAGTGSRGSTPPEMRPGRRSCQLHARARRWPTSPRPAPGPAVADRNRGGSPANPRAPPPADPLPPFAPRCRGIARRAGAVAGRGGARMVGAGWTRRAPAVCTEQLSCTLSDLGGVVA